ncbi:SDR family oxidoreductase, partial [Mesorhizobium sp. M7A.F.Ca.US.006.01.1.1]|uniref:SDR family NAD(P)-dependent oxidoreductase n=1 Tax=Mesorhizobium sp. M7A.F.Ca.US.006.01.1.1 TaxID=2496707 RepID=UPI000FCA4980
EALIRERGGDIRTGADVASIVQSNGRATGVRLASGETITANNGMEGLSLYNASKSAVRSFARTWANDLRGRKIRVNALSPGFTLTPLMENGLHMGDAEIEALKEYTAREVPLGYMAEPAEIATAALFLASQDAKYINGIELTADGGVSQI